MKINKLVVGEKYRVVSETFKMTAERIQAHAIGGIEVPCTEFVGGHYQGLHGNPAKLRHVFTESPIPGSVGKLEFYFAPDDPQFMELEFEKE